MPKVVHSHLFFWCCLGSRVDMWSLTGELSIALHPYTGSTIISNLSDRAPSHPPSLPLPLSVSFCLLTLLHPSPPTRLF